MRTSRTHAFAALTLTAILTTASCGSTSGNPEPTTSATASDAADPSPTGDAPTGESSIPADWKLVTIDVAEVHVPPTWDVKAMGKNVHTLGAPKSKVGISPGAGNFGSDAYIGDESVKVMVEKLAKHENNLMKNVLELDKVQRFDDVTINGTLFYHFRAESEFEWIDEYGTVTPDGSRQVSFAWSFNKSSIGRKKAEALINEVMPTFKLL